MVDKNLTSLTINTLLIGVLVIGLISSYVLLVNNEGYGSMFDNYTDIKDYNLNFTNSYTDGRLIETSNINSNISANYNPELSQSGGDQSGNAIAINLQDLITLTWTTLGFLGFILFGSIYSSFISILVMSIIGYITVAYIIKAIRTGET